MPLQEVAIDLQALAPRLAAKAPSGWRLIFLNYEFADHERGAVSDCLAIAVCKAWLSSPRKQQIPTDANEYQILNRACRALCAKAGQSFLTLDVVITRDNRFKSYVDYAQPARIGGDLMATRRYMKYVQEYPLLSQDEP